VWSHLAPRVMTRFRVVAIDLRGHGNSDWDPQTSYDAQTFAEDLAKVISAFGFDKTVLIGHSWGAATAIRFAAANPAKVSALVIVDFGPELAQAGVDEVLKGLLDTPRSFASADQYANWLAERRPLAESRLLGQFARYSLRQAADGQWVLKSDAALGTVSEITRLPVKDGRYRVPELWTCLAQIKCPCLVIRGAASGVFPRDVAARVVERAPPDTRLQTIEAAGHAVMMDNPADFGRAVEEFLIAATAASTAAP